MVFEDVTMCYDVAQNRRRIRVDYGEVLVARPWPDDIVAFVERLSADFVPTWAVYEQLAASCHDTALADRIRTFGAPRR